MIRSLGIAAALGAALAAGPAFAAVDVQEVTSPGGIDAWLIEEPSIPFTAIEIRFGGGASLDREGKRGAINLMTGLLEEGAGDLNAQEFAAARDGLAASYSFGADDDYISVSARFLTENRDEAVDLLRTALVEPTFEQEAVDRVRDQVLSIIASSETDPGAVAMQSWDAGAFPDHPYGTPIEGTEESVTGLTPDDMVQAHRDTLVRDRVHVAAAGDISPEELGEVIDTLLGDLPETSEAPLPGSADYSRESGAEVVPLDVPQSVVLFGHRGFERDHPDFMEAYVLNHIIGGGGFESRLMEQIRVQRGLTYGIGTWLAPMDHADLFMGQASTANANVGEMVDVLREEWAQAAEGVTQEELDAAKTYLTGAYPLRFDGNSSIAGILVSMQMDDLPIDYVDTRNDEIEAITLDGINTVAADLFHPDALSFVAVGQPEGIEATN